MPIVIDNLGSPERDSRLRTLSVFAHTLSCSARVIGQAAAGSLSSDSVDAVLERWYTHVFRVSHTSLTVQGLERLTPDQPYLLLSNHSSLLDIPAVCGTFPGSVRFVAKAELRRVPLFGRAMAEGGILFVDRADRAGAIAALSGAGALIERGNSLWIAAEGRRTDGDALGPFKKGPFHVALQLGVPIVPTWIQGAAAVIKAGSLVSRSGKVVDVVYGEPIATTGLGKADIPALM